MTCPSCEYEPVPLTLKPPVQAITHFFHEIEGEVKLMNEITEDNPMYADCWSRLFIATQQLLTYMETRMT